MACRKETGCGLAVILVGYKFGMLAGYDKALREEYDKLDEEPIDEENEEELRRTINHESNTGN